MRQEDIPVTGFTLKHGAIGGVLLIVHALLLFALDLSESTAAGLSAYAVMIAVILWAQIDYRRSEILTIGYGDTLKTGLMASVYMVLIGTVYTVIHWSFVDPDLPQRMLAAGEEALRQQGLPEDQIEASLNMQRNMMGPVVTPVIGAVSNLVIALIICLLTSIGTRRNSELELDESDQVD